MHGMTLTAVQRLKVLMLADETLLLKCCFLLQAFQSKQMQLNTLQQSAASSHSGASVENLPAAAAAGAI